MTPVASTTCMVLLILSPLLIDIITLALVVTLILTITLVCLHLDLDLHPGMPGILGGLLSVLGVWLATPEIYGPALYLIVGNMAPEEGTEALAKVVSALSSSS